MSALNVSATLTTLNRQIDALYGELQNLRAVEQKLKRENLKLQAMLQKVADFRIDVCDLPEDDALIFKWKISRMALQTMNVQLFEYIFELMRKKYEEYENDLKRKDLTNGHTERYI